MKSHKKSEAAYAELFRLEEQIHSTRMRMQALQNKASERALIVKGIQEEIHHIKCEIQLHKLESSPGQMFERLCGVIVDQGNANNLSIRFTPVCFGRRCGDHSLLLKRLPTNQWIFAYSDLPSSIKFLPDQILEENIFSKEVLCNFLRKIQRQVQAHAMRSEQFRVTQNLIQSPKLNLYPAFNSLNATIVMWVSDSESAYDENIIRVCLTYRPDTILPKDVCFKFYGGNDEFRRELEITMSVVREIYLPDACRQIFSLENQIDSSGETVDTVKGGSALRGGSKKCKQPGKKSTRI